MDLPTIWFALVAALLTGYAILDGFDLGVGVLSLRARSDEEKRIHLNAIGPVWDGNEVWLLTGGGALFAAFPVVYATVFSGFYLAMMLVVAALVARAASFEFRGKSGSPRWRRAWDLCFGLGSLVAALLYGVAVGNVVRGVPIDGAQEYAARFPDTFLGLLNPYALLIGLVTLTLFTAQGAAWMAVKTEGELQARMRRALRVSWAAFGALFAAASAWTLLALPHAVAEVTNPLLWILVALLVAALAAVPALSTRGRDGRAFVASSATIVAVIALAAVGMYPKLVTSSLDPAWSLTARNAASTPLTQTVMLAIALVGMPLVIGYTAYVYRVFKGKVVLGPESY
ncbi:MAG: cytochrome d ubiquinol oxidase subunit II [Gemmatimonadota bacterium]|nr:cytochrome d ubiquinol oxidase subunit II [Gemmatimonadota bacterium]